MRIRVTVGGILIIAVIGGVLFFIFPTTKYYTLITQESKKVVDKVTWFFGLSGKKPVSAEKKQAPEVAFPSETPAVAVSTINAVPVTPVVESPVPAQAASAPPAESKVAPAAPKAKAARKSRKKRLLKKRATPRSTPSTSSAVTAPPVAPPSAAEPPAPSQPAAPAPSAPAASSKPKKAAGYDSLIGTYVSLELKNGRSVKGVLEEVTPTTYKVQLPGLGSFPYPVENVKEIKPAE
ncbi:MAG: hypothetical protein LHV69_10480 [Elusimicrobia bacterium]|nr:hypothetical protein [Candidatus Obscuribacterium magneticum]